MEKNIKDYLHLYKGCKCHTPDGIMEMSYVEDGSANWPVWFGEKCNEANSEILSNDGCCAKGYKYNQVKPILRPLSDMTEEEENMYYSFYHNPFSKNVRQSILMDSQAIHYLLSKYFDLFGLIEAGLAIDATKQNTNL
jgi:hypothetical protein